MKNGTEEKMHINYALIAQSLWAGFFDFLKVKEWIGRIFYLLSKMNFLHRKPHITQNFELKI